MSRLMDGVASAAAETASEGLSSLTLVTAIVAAVAFAVLLAYDSKVNKIEDVAVKSSARSGIAVAFIVILFAVPIAATIDIGYWS